MKSLLFLFLFYYSFVGVSQAPFVQWSKYYGGTEDEIVRDIIQTTDGGYLLIGHSRSSGNDVSSNLGLEDFWIVRLNSLGNIEWEKTFGGSAEDYAFCGEQTDDGGFIIGGVTDSEDGDVSSNNGKEDFWLIKLDSSGNLEWEKTYGGSLDERILDLKITSDGGYILGGNSISNDGDLSGNFGDYDNWILKVDSSGVIIWEKNYGGSLNDFVGSIFSTADGGYIVAGQTYSIDIDVSENNGMTDVLVYKIDSAGNIVWLQTFGGSSNEWGASLIETTDDKILVGCSTYSDDGDVTGQSSGGEYWLIMLDQNGVYQWNKTYGGSGQDILSMIQETSDGGFILAGSSSSTDGDVDGGDILKNCWLVQTNSTGTIQWNKSFGSSRPDDAYCVDHTIDNGFVVAGKSQSSTSSWGIGSFDYMVTKLGPSGLIKDIYTNQVSIFPNPSNGKFILSSNTAFIGNDFFITDNTGRLIQNGTIQIENSKIDISQYEKGVYYLRIVDQSRAIKIIKH